MMHLLFFLWVALVRSEAPIHVDKNMQMNYGTHAHGGLSKQGGASTPNNQISASKLRGAKDDWSRGSSVLGIAKGTGGSSSSTTKGMLKGAYEKNVGKTKGGKTGIKGKYCDKGHCTRKRK